MPVPNTKTPQQPSPDIIPISNSVADWKPSPALVEALARLLRLMPDADDEVEAPTAPTPPPAAKPSRRKTGKAV
jgi:hypothetical protein